MEIFYKKYYERIFIPIVIYREQPEHVSKYFKSILQTFMSQLVLNSNLDFFSFKKYNQNHESFSS